MAAFVATFALVIVPSLGDPMFRASPRRMPKKGWPDEGAVINVIWFPFIV